jgi:hypothetical protein
MARERLLKKIEAAAARKYEPPPQPEEIELKVSRA